MPLVMLMVLLLAVAPGLRAQAPSAMRSPTVSADGRLVFEMYGDLWLRPIASDGEFDQGVAVPLTQGLHNDRDPAWTTDGRSVVFASDRAGGYDLWTVAVDANGRASAPSRLTSSPVPETDPAPTPGGAIVYVRGHAGARDLWMRTADGVERALFDGAGDERSPAVSSDGRLVAYVADGDGRRQLRQRALDGSHDRLVTTEGAPEFPAWSPTDSIIVFSTRGTRPGVWTTPLDGAYLQLASQRRAEAVWMPDGRALLLTTLPRPEPGYNGDPHRGTDREDHDLLSEPGMMWVVQAPLPPDAGAQQLDPRPVLDRQTRNADAFDRVWTRLDDLYYSATRGTQWQQLRDRFRPQALTAATTEELERVIHSMLRQRPTTRPEARGRAGISSAHPLATAAGAEILERGGNVVDAAVAVSFALGVVEPDASGVGGYGEMVLYLDGMVQPVVIEFLTRVPEAASLSNASLTTEGGLPEDGPVLANVPGTVAGMYLAWERYGSGAIEWSALLAPAIRLAEDGFVLDEALPTTLALERDRFLRYESSRQLFFPSGEPLTAGDTLVNPDLAWTLRQIAGGGAKAFYDGPVAQRLVRDLAAHGNAMTTEDMARYYAVRRDPVIGTYRGHTVYSGAPAVSGGAALVGKLHLLDYAAADELYVTSPVSLHAMIEAWKLAPSTQGRIADPSLWPVNLEPFVNRDSARIRWERCYDPDRATGPEELTRRHGGPACYTELASVDADQQMPCEVDPTSCRSTGTTAFAVADGDGNLVAVTQTLGTWGGNFYVTPGLGFLYNDKLRSYSSDPASYNARIPFARNSTSIAPTLVFRGTGPDRRPYAALGAAGNAWITSAVYQMTVGMIAADLGPQEALELPRFLVSTRRQGNAPSEVVVQIEDGIDPRALEVLETMGHTFQRISLPGEMRMGYGAAVVVEDGTVRAGADPRRSGAAAAIR
jgi:gamma-glutamyltranspeptidase